MLPGAVWAVIAWFVVAGCVCVRSPLFLGHLRGPLGSFLAAVFISVPAWGVAVLARLLAGGDGGLLLAGCQYAMWGLAAGGRLGLSGLVHLWTMGWQPGGLGPVWVTWVLAAAVAVCFWFYSTAQGVYAIWFWGWAGGGCWAAAASLLRGVYAFHLRLGRGLGHIFFYPWRVARYWGLAVMQLSQAWGAWDEPWDDSSEQHLLPAVFTAWLDRCVASACEWSAGH
jgi:hypothetical protein